MLAKCAGDKPSWGRYRCSHHCSIPVALNHQAFVGKVISRYTCAEIVGLRSLGRLKSLGELDPELQGYAPVNKLRTVRI